MGQDPQPWTLGAVEIDNWGFVSGNKLNTLAYPDLYVPMTSSGTVLDFSLAGHAQVPIISARAWQVFEPLPNVSVIPIKVASLDAQFFVLVVEETQRALDTERSRFERFTEHDRIRPDLAGQIKSAFELRIDPSLADGSRIFRLADGPTYVFVHDDVKRRVERLNLTGFAFDEA